MMKNKYHILWIDDEWEIQTSFITSCKLRYQMELHPFKTQKDGLDEYAKHPTFYDAAILDAEILNNNENESPNVANLQKAVLRIASDFRDLPYFISTGKPAVLNNPMFTSLYSRYYEKSIDDEKLCQDVIKAIDNSENRKITNKYPELFSLIKDHFIYEEMLAIIKVHESQDKANADVFNKIRKVVDWTMYQLNDYGLLSIQFNGTNLNKCSKALDKEQLNKYVPIYIQRHFHSLTTIANEGSHRATADGDVKNGRAPYLVSSTIFELINVLIWLHKLPQDKDSKNEIDAIVANLAMDEEQKASKKKRT